MKEPAPGAKPTLDNHSPGSNSPQEPQHPRSSQPFPPDVPDHELLRPIGEGSFGEVWLARNKLGTLRAVKIVYRSTFEDSRPFEREFKGIQKFEPISRSHDGLVDILQVGGKDEYFYYVMELADAAEPGTSNQCSVGQSSAANEPLRAHDRPNTDSLNTDLLNTYHPRTLRSDVRRLGRLPIAQCLDIGRSLASALAHLHAQGLVHRDIKPSNIIFVQGAPKLADIGLVTDASEARSFVGTEGFIPPEGPGAAQADLYSLGKVLYEISTGRDRRDFPALPDDLAEDEAMLELNAVILKACKTDLKERYASASEMLADLELLHRGKSVKRKRLAQRRWAMGLKAAAAVSGLAVIAATAWLLFQGFNASTLQRSNASTSASIFVLPFRNVGTNRVDELIRSRMTDAMIEGFGLFKGVNVRPRKSGWSKLDNTTLMRRAAVELGARFVVTGEATQNSNRFGLKLRVLQTPDGRVVAQETVGGDTNNLAAFELAALEVLAKHLGLAIDSDHRRQIEKKLADNVEALEFYRRGLQLPQRGRREDFTARTEQFNRAIDLDRNYLQPYLELALTYRVMSEYEQSPILMWPEVRNRAMMALRIDETCADAHHWLAGAKLFYEYDWAGAVSEFETQFESDSAPSIGHAFYLRTLGRIDEARVEQEKVLQVNALDGGIRSVALGQFLVERRYQEGLAFYQRSRELAPGAIDYYGVLPRILTGLGKYAEAVETIQQNRTVTENPVLLARLGQVYAKMANRAKAEATLAELMALSRARYVSPYFVAWIHAALGNDEEAINWLERAYEERSELLVQCDDGGLRTDPAWDGLQAHPRFHELRKKVGLDVWPK